MCLVQIIMTPWKAVLIFVLTPCGIKKKKNREKTQQIIWSSIHVLEYNTDYLFSFCFTPLLVWEEVQMYESVTKLDENLA